MLNGRTTYSPTLTLSTPSPTSTTWPRFSCPNQRPGSKSVRPSYMCRSEPQMFADVILTRTSVARSIRASGTSLTLTCRGPSYTTAFMLPPFLADTSQALGPRFDYTRRGSRSVSADMPIPAPWGPVGQQHRVDKPFLAPQRLIATGRAEGRGPPEPRAGP